MIHGALMSLWLLLFASAFLLHGLLAWSIGIVYVGYDTALVGFVFWRTLALAKPNGVAPARRTSLSLGVIVAAHNEATVLPATIGALFRQTEPPDLIVIADDGSTDGTAALLERDFGLVKPEIGSLSGPSAAHPTLYWLRLARGGKPVALNEAVARMVTAMVLTVDADTLLDREALSAMRDAFSADQTLVAATGILTPVCGDTFEGRVFERFQIYEYVRNFLSRYAWMRMDSLLLISGAFAAFRTAALREVGGFDPVCLVEDYELIHRLRRYSVRHDRGWTTAVIGRARAITDAPSSLRTFLNQRRRWFGGFLQTQYWYRDMVGNGAYGWLGKLMLPVKAADTLQPVYGLTAFGLLVFYLVSGRLSLVGLVAGVMGLKLLIDLVFLAWSVHLYRRWTGLASVGIGAALLAALLEPFSFQLLRHLGATLGWGVFLTGRHGWGAQQRLGLARRSTVLPAAGQSSVANRRWPS